MKDDPRNGNYISWKAWRKATVVCSTMA